MPEQAPHPLHDPADPSTAWALNPWVPITDPLDLKYLGKFLEELGEAVSATARCVIQGVEGRHPITGKVNMEWLEEEIADVLANIDLVTEHFELDHDAIVTRWRQKLRHLRAWHEMLAPLSPSQTTQA